MRRHRAGLAVLCGLLVVGCTPAGQDQANQTAVEFQRRVTAADWNGACALLSEHARHGLESAAAHPCVDALPALRLPTGPVDGIQVWGRNAGAEIGSGTLFLSRFPAGWRVFAAGCTPQGQDMPDDCTVGG